VFGELPPENEREALIDAMAELVRARGSEPLVQWPILLATPEYFPDPWSPDLQGCPNHGDAHASLRGNE